MSLEESDKARKRYWKDRNCVKGMGAYRFFQGAVQYYGTLGRYSI